MIRTADLLDQLHALGAELVRVGPDRLRLYDPQGAVTSALRDELRARKTELLAYLAPHPCASCGWHLFPSEGNICYWCRQGRTSPGPGAR